MRISDLTTEERKAFEEYLLSTYSSDGKADQQEMES